MCGLSAYDEKAGPEENSFDLHIQINGEVDAEVVGVSEGLLHHPGPLLTDPAHVGGLIHRQNLKREKKHPETHVTQPRSREAACLLVK